MFDDTPAEPGTLRHGFLTDSSGRRIYFPPLGPARWVPSPEQEKAFKERLAVWMTIAFVIALVALFVLIVTIDTYNGTGHALVIVFGGRLLGECLIVRQWPLMDDETITYRRVVINDLLRRSTVRLCCLAFIAVLGAIFFVVMPVWGYWFGPVDWSKRTLIEVIISLHLTAVLCAALTIYFLLQAHRMTGVLRMKLSGATPQAVP
jgi:hypothetical protein